MTHEHHHHILFYSPVLKSMRLNTKIKRPQPVLETISGLCVRCQKPSVITVRKPKFKRSINVQHSLCQDGHVEVEIIDLLNSDHSYQYF